MRSTHPDPNPMPVSSPRRAATARGTAASRGSALLMVLGTLALIAVFAAIYLTLGRADRRAAAAVERRGEVDRAADAGAGHAASVIALDRLGATSIIVPNASGGNGYQQGFRRENIDAPIIDFSRRSQPNASDPFQSPSNPAGYHLQVLTGTNLLRDTRIADDPWLSSGFPTYLGGDDPGVGTSDARSPLAPGGRVWSSELNGGITPSLFWLDNRDLAQISNFAPDLRFVNLYNLRPGDPDGDGIFGGFDAESGIGTYSADGRQRARTTHNLTLLRLAQAGNADSPIQAFDPQTGGVWVPGLSTPQTATTVFGGGVDLLNVPAVWTANQRYMHFPINQPFFTLDRDGDIATWESPDFAAYQYADANGDGFADSRWIELVDASDPDNIVNVLGIDPGDARVFFAFHAMDLSSLVNINTATDSVVAPSEEHPYGLTPAEIDLRRLLMMSDFAIETGAGPHLLDNYSRGNGDPAGDYRGYGVFGDKAEQFVQYQPGQHDAISLYLNPDASGVPVAADQRTASAGGFAPAEEIGRIAYDAIRVELEPMAQLALDARGPYLDPRLTTFGAPDADPTIVPQSLFTTSRFELNPPMMEGDPWTIRTSLAEQAEARADYYEDVAAREPGSSLRGASSLFDTDDLAELLTYRGINDPAETSRLETTVRGRAVVGLARPAGQAPNAQQGRTDRLDPLFSSRALELDRSGLGDGRINRTQDPFRAIAQDGYLSVTGKIDEEAMLFTAMSPRLRLTTHSGAVPLRSSLVTVLNEQLPGLTQGEVRSELSTSPAALYSVYASALAPTSGIRRNPMDRDAVDFGLSNSQIDPAAWSMDQLRYNSLYYGYAGPEFALRLAGHASVNAAAMFGGTAGGPIAATLIIDNALRRDIIDQNDDDNNPDQRAFPWFTGGALDAGGSRLAGRPPRDNATLGGGQPQLAEFDDAMSSSAAGGQAYAGRQAVNLFDLGTHPIITEVAAISIFTDVPQVAGGDAEWTTGTAYANPRSFIQSNIGAWLPAVQSPLPDLDQPVTLSGNIPGAPQSDVYTTAGPGTSPNPDLMLHVLVFQLHNPYDTAITLGERGGRQNTTGLNPQWADTVMHDSRPDRPGLEFPFNYYLEYAGRFFKLGQYVQSDTNEQTPRNDDHVAIANPNWRYRTTVIGPGETRNFYVLAHDEGIDTDSDDFRTLNNRWRAVITATSGTTGLNNLGLYGTQDPQQQGDTSDDDPADPTTYNNNSGYADDNRFTGPVEEWLIRQLTVDGVAPARIKEFDPRNGAVITPLGSGSNNATVRDLTKVGTDNDANAGIEGRGPLFGDIRASEETARLWRRMSIAGEEGLGPNQATNTIQEENFVSNDFMADRLTNLDEISAPGGITFSGGAIDGTIAFEDSFPLEENPCAASNPRSRMDESSEGARQDNTGWTILRWKAARRAAGPEPDAEVVAPWMMQARFGSGVAVPVEMDGTSDANIMPTNIDSWTEDCGSVEIDVNGRVLEVWRKVRMSNSLRPGGVGLSIPIDAETQRSFLAMFSMSFTATDATRTPGAPTWPVRPAPAGEDTDRFNIVASLATAPQDKRTMQAGGAFNQLNDTVTKFQVGSNVPTFDNLSSERIDDTDQYDPGLVGTRRLTPVRHDANLIETPRPADALLAWAVGPVNAPWMDSSINRSNTGVHGFNPDAEWITGAEMIAMALGYERPELIDADDDLGRAIDDIYTFLYSPQAAMDVTAGPDDAYALDSGRLRIDAFVPFINLDNSTDVLYDGITRPVFNEANLATRQRRDVPYGEALPLALGVVDRFTGNRDAAEDALPELLLPAPFPTENTQQYAARVRNLLTASGHPFAQHLPSPAAANAPDAYRNTAQQRWEQQIRPLLSIVRGRININTAPPEVLRLVPGLSPLPEYREVMISGGAAAIGSIVPEEPFAFYSRLNSQSTRDVGMLSRDAVDFATAVTANDQLTARLTALPDVAATLVAYRDRSRANLRALSDPNGAITGVPGSLGYDPRFPTEAGRSATAGTNYAFDTGRANNTGIGLRDPAGANLPSALRGGRGFASQAEILAAVYRATDDPSTAGFDERTEIFDAYRSSLINAYAIDADNTEDLEGPNGVIPIVSERWDTSTGSTGNPGNRVADDYDERLALANSVLNSIDVRSDIFAVWFVMHVYTPTDVENLQPADPLVPSIARRYLMVVDRSNVIGPEDRPKILLFREVPL